MFKTKREKLAYVKGIRKGKGFNKKPKTTYSKNYQQGIFDYYLCGVLDSAKLKNKDYAQAVNDSDKVVEKGSYSFIKKEKLSKRFKNDLVKQGYVGFKD